VSCFPISSPVLKIIADGCIRRMGSIAIGVAPHSPYPAGRSVACLWVSEAIVAPKIYGPWFQSNAW